MAKGLDYNTGRGGIVAFYRRVARMLVSLLILIALPWSSLIGQEKAGHGLLTGQVFDFTGAEIPYAEIVLTDSKMRAIRRTSSNLAGIYEFASLVPGSYSLRISSSGFFDVQREIRILPGTQTIFDTPMKIDYRVRVPGLYSEVPSPPFLEWRHLIGRWTVECGYISKVVPQNCGEPFTTAPVEIDSKGSTFVFRWPVMRIPTGSMVLSKIYVFFHPSERKGRVRSGPEVEDTVLWDFSWDGSDVSLVQAGGDDKVRPVYKLILTNGYTIILKGTSQGGQQLVFIATFKKEEE